MGKYAYVKQRLPDWDAKTAEDIKTAIKAYCLKSVLRHRKKEAIFKAIEKEIQLFRDEFDEDEKPIAEGYERELRNFAADAYEMAFHMVAGMTPYMFSQSLVNPEILTESQKEKVVENSAYKISVPESYKPAPQAKPLAADSNMGYRMGTAGNVQYSEIHTEIESRMKLFGEFSKSRNYTGNVNARNITEMGVRFERYLRKKERLKNKGVRLVVVPAHANCSERCQPYQGRVYSLDGTSGTVDGRRFVPIEEVADEKVVHGKRDPSRIYANGLFAYNCRHDLEEYHEGQNIQQIPAAVISKTREAEKKQRQMEIAIREQKEKAMLYGVVLEESGNKNLLPTVEKMQAKIKKSENAYRAYCHKSGLVIYEERLQVVSGENLYIRKRGAKNPVIQKTKI